MVIQTHIFNFNSTFPRNNFLQIFSLSLKISSLLPQAFDAPLFLKRLYFLRASSSLQLTKALSTIIFLSPCFLLLLGQHSTTVTSCLIHSIRFFLSLAPFYSVLFRIGGYSIDQFACLQWLLSLNKNILTATTNISCGTTEDICRFTVLQ
jgi:hypothetical protein